MYNLFRFIGRNHFFFLFLLLEIISFGLIVTYNYYPAAVYFKWSTAVNGKVRETTAHFHSYLGLRKANLELATENAILRSASRQSFLAADTHVYQKHDTLYAQRYKYITARVVGNSVGLLNNFIMIDKGSRSGVGIDMGVTGPRGVVGIVVAVSENFSTVMPVLHSATVISAKLKSNNQLASVTWDGASQHKAQMVNLSGQVKIVPGDTVITSGYSLIFPEGIMVGTIERFNLNPDDSYYDITLNLSTDFGALSYVYVVQNLFREEQEKLLQKQKEIIQGKR
jgi:rod shape-determining protein MreC